MFLDGLQRRLQTGLCLLGILAAHSAVAEMVVIVGKGGPDAMTKEQVADVFLGKAASLPGGAAAAPQDQPEASPLRDEFYTKMTGKSAAQAKAYWSKLAFTGKGTPPPEAANSAAVKKAVAAAPGGIGYVEKAAADATVKVVLTVH